MNSVQLVGRVGRKPELHTTGGGSPVAFFSIATDSYVRGKGEETIKKTTWLPLVIFGPAAVNLVSVLQQGSLVAVNGELTTRKVQDLALNSHVEVNVKVLGWQLLAHPRAKPASGNGAEGGEPEPVDESGKESAEIEGDDIPF